MSLQTTLCECGATMADGGSLGMYCTNASCLVEKALVRQIATLGANLTRKDSVTLTAESSRLQGLLAEITELKRLLLCTAKARDDYRDDYHRINSDYLDFKYPGSVPRHKALGRTGISQHLRWHADAISELMKLLVKLESPVHPDHPPGSREPPHCQSCSCGLHADSVSNG